MNNKLHVQNDSHESQKDECLEERRHNKRARKFEFWVQLIEMLWTILQMIEKLAQFFK